MNKKQTFKFVQQIALAYPNFEPTLDRLELWTRKMSSIDYDIAAYRLDKYIDSNRFAPTIADILNPDGPKRRADEGASPAAVINGGSNWLGGDE